MIFWVSHLLPPASYPRKNILTLILTSVLDFRHFVTALGMTSFIFGDLISYEVIYRVDQKNGDLKQNGHNYLEIHQKGKKLVCSGKFSLNAAG